MVAGFDAAGGASFGAAHRAAFANRKTMHA
jgi:hypothetical protein